MSLAIIAVVGALGYGATQALFSDTATITSSTFSAASLDLKIDSDPSGSVYTWSDGFANPVNPFAKVKPGSTGEQIIDIKNVGEINSNATIKLTRTSTPWNELSSNLTFAIFFDGNHDGTFETTGPTGTLDTLTDTYVLGLVEGNSIDGITDGKIASVKIEWSVPSSAGNDIQGDSVTIDTTFGLEQIPE